MTTRILAITLPREAADPTLQLAAALELELTTNRVVPRLQDRVEALPELETTKRNQMHQILAPRALEITRTQMLRVLAQQLTEAHPARTSMKATVSIKLTTRAGPSGSRSWHEKIVLIIITYLLKRQYFPIAENST